MNELQRTDVLKPKQTWGFQPGKSGNPLGRPKSDATLREMARKHTQTALDALVSIVKNEKSPPAARAAAATALLDRAWGRPSQHIEALHVASSLQDFLDQIAEADAGNLIELRDAGDVVSVDDVDEFFI